MSDYLPANTCYAISLRSSKYWGLSGASPEMYTPVFSWNLVDEEKLIIIIDKKKIGFDDQSKTRIIWRGYIYGDVI